MTRNGIPVSYSTGLLGLQNVDEVTLLTAPDEHDFGTNVRDRLLVQCEALRDRFAILSVDESQRNVVNIINDRPSLYGAIYWPWIYVAHPNGRDRVLAPPVGHVAGICAPTSSAASTRLPPTRSSWARSTSSSRSRAGCRTC
jgi:phage tail sheath protein FI